jgi:carboxyl-terminal processing protease
MKSHPSLQARLLSGALLVLGLLPSAFALAPVTDPESLRPTPLQARAAELITHFLTNYHYRRTRLDDALASRIFDKYVDALDGGHSFFLESDLERFAALRTQLDDQLLSGSLKTPFEIFRLYRQRVGERVDYAQGLLRGTFDFSLNEDFLINRKDAPWPHDSAEVDEIWRKRVKNDLLSLQLAGKSPGEAVTTLKRRYETLRRQTEQLTSDDVFQIFVNAYTTAIEPHTSYFSPRSSENFRIRMSLSLEGIGAVLQTEDEHTLVREVVPGGPADLVGRLRKGDRIVGIAQGKEDPFTDVVGWRLDDVVDLVRGPKGSVVRLQVLPKAAGLDGRPVEVAITRNRIALEEQAAQKRIVEVSDASGHKRRMGVIDLDTFYLDFDARARGDKNYRSTTRDVRRLLTELQAEGVDGVIVDLRGNGGGSLTEATELTGLFIPEGPVVQVRDANGRIGIERDPDPQVVYGGPLAVLVDRYSASASEIFAGAIQDYRRGIIIGEPTFGKGTVQNLVDLDEFDPGNAGKLGQLKATIAQFFRVAGGSTQHKGVVPDVRFPLGSPGEEDGERSYENALPWDEVSPATFQPTSAPVELFARVRALHEQRVATRSEFGVIHELVRAREEALAARSVSLNESERRADQRAKEEQALALENRLRSERGLPPLAKLPDAEEEIVEEDDKEDILADVLLDESARILGDLISMRLGGEPVMAATVPAPVPAAR